MIEETLEIRGINRKDLTRYLLELRTETEDNASFQGNNWSCFVSEEDTFRFLQSDVPKVILIFRAENQETLKDIIKKFRKKTFRIGG